MRDIVCCNNTVITDHYLHVLQKGFLPFLLGMGVNFGEKFFQKDRAWPHTADAVLDVLNENTDQRVLSNHLPEWFGYGWPWPP
jgi:hypothetical protein